jgi:hypothetical protein
VSRRAPRRSAACEPARAAHHLSPRLRAACSTSRASHLQKGMSNFVGGVVDQSRSLRRRRGPRHARHAVVPRAMTGRGLASCRTAGSRRGACWARVLRRRDPWPVASAFPFFRAG